MTPRIAEMSEEYADRPREDRLAATIAYCDSDGVYRLRVMKPSDVPAFIEAEWDRWIPTMVDFG